MRLNKYFAGGAVCAFLSVISFFTINSYFADKHHVNGLFWIAGFLFAAGAIYFYWKLTQTTGGGGKEQR